MPQQGTLLLAIYVDGETKTGKGAASAAIADALSAKGYTVYYDVAGDFYRRYVALVRINLGLSEDDKLPTGDVLERAAREVYESGEQFKPNPHLGDLQRRSISKSVSVLGELPLAQQAGREWWAMTLRNAREAEADVLVVDGRNPRRRVMEQVEPTGIDVHSALDLFMTCEAREAARRVLLGEGIKNPTDEQLTSEEVKVADRRSRDRQRLDTPFLQPDAAIHFVPGNVTTDEILSASWHPGPGIVLPRTLILDNTTISKPFMLETVTTLAKTAVDTLARTNDIRAKV